jgi:SAM-dependent methyltransferase
VTGSALYDPIARWYDREFATSALGGWAREIVLRLLGEGPGRLVDVGCGGGSHAIEFANRGWTVIGVDVSEQQLRLARARGVDALAADASALPFADEEFDAAVSMFTHTDVGDFAMVVSEIARVLRPHGAFVYLGTHPCFVGPHSQFVAATGVPTLHPGYRDQGRYTEAPGISPGGLRARVGATHLPLDAFLHAFLAAGLRLETFEEPLGADRLYPYIVALRLRR